MEADPPIGQNPLIYQRWLFLADKIEADHSLLRIPLKNIERWIAAGRLGSTWALDEWKAIIENAQASGSGMQSLLEFLRDDGERARQLEELLPVPRSPDPRRTRPFHMRLDSLIHLSRAVLAMTEVDRIVVFGSASLLATHPELGEVKDSPFLHTYDADFIPFPFEEEVGLMLDEAFGEERTFHQRFGYHADIVRPKVAETFPSNWEERVTTLSDFENVQCLDPHDMAATKCVIGRDKDHTQLSYLIRAGIIKPAIVRQRLREIPLSEKILAKGHRFLDELVASSE